MAKGRTNEKAVIELIINGEKAKTSLKEVRTTMIGLERQLANMKKADDPAGYDKVRKQLDQVRKAHQSMLTEIRGGEGSLLKFKGTWKDIAAGFVGGSLIDQGIGMLKQGIVSLISTNALLSDSLADVSKQTGITGKDLTELNTELNELNTRTPVDELRKLAVVAGKLGYETKDEVLSFVKAADMLNVALGEDLGGNTEEALNDIGKLVAIFGLEQEFGIEKSMLKVGSAINTVGASSQANEGYLVNWAKRFAGIAPNAGISIADTMGMAAAADILGQSSELSATNIGKMIIAMGKDVPYFAKVAGMQVKEFSKLLKTDGNEAFLRVLEGAKSSTKGVEGLAKMLETLGIEGSEGAAVLGAFAKNTELVRKQQEIANSAFEKGTSVIDEFNTKNQNNAAILDKIQKKLSTWWESTAAGISPFIELFGKWAGVVSELDLNLKELQKQQEKVAAVESKFPALLARYDELKSKTNLSTKEQQELQKIVNAIADEVPQAATSFDKYGNAMDISRDKAAQFIANQRSLLETMRQTRREMLKEEVADLDRRAKVVQWELNQKKKMVVNSGGQLVEQNFTKEEFEQRRKEAQKLNEEITQRRRDLAGLEGIDDIDTRRKRRDPNRGKLQAGNPSDSPAVPYVGPTRDQAKKAREEQKKLNDDLLKEQQRNTINMMGERDKELQAAQYKYDELRKRAGKNSKDLERINELHQQEVGNISQKYNKKFLTDFDKTIRGQLNVINSQAKEENEAEQKHQDEILKRQDEQLFEINHHYEQEIAAAKARGESIVEIEKRWRQEVDALKAERAKKANDELLDGVVDSYRSELAMAEENGESKEQIVRDQLERLRLLREDYGTMEIDQQKRINSEIAKADRELLAIKLDQIQKTGQAMSEGGQVISDVLTLAAGNQNEYAEFQKALGIFQIAVDTGTAIASAVAAGTKGDPYTVALRIAAAVAAVTAGMVKAKALINSAEQPDAPAFRAQGGPTDLGSIEVDKSGAPAGWVTRPTLFSLGRRSYVAGEAGAEYVVSNKMLQNPVVADFTSMLEAMRTGRAFADGGSTAMPAAGPMTGDMSTQFAIMIGLLQKVVDKPSGINYEVFEKFEDQIANTRQRASA
ncbi:phage tail tape measure protein [Dyadobacter sp. CY261]|uniref:phage tail tape measure protein n=1 Tax=Dyadobacter sp. CY261 TaxID=2907203 RepID=UPI001F3D3E79|nr:phage tail tape measure protein [Dyadobacter sp. CY261]MCF0071268.1 phage tail tape measure protein [Dyadobacter sp. CY261]